MLATSASEILQIVLLTAMVGVLLFVALLYLQRTRQFRHYDLELQRAEIERIRASLESRLYELNTRLVASENRWRDVNHLILSSVAKTPELDRIPKQSGLTAFLAAAGLTEIDLRIDSQLVFVLTPFHSEHDETFETIATVAREAGLRCLRGDEEFVRGDLLSHILRLLVSARLVIANIDGRNPNVFYELGLAHAMDKTTIIVSRGAEQLPFDMRSRKLIIYDKPSALREALQRELTRALVSEGDSKSAF